MSALLVQADGGEPLWLTGKFTIGRGDGCTVRLSDVYASSLHAVCTPGVDGWTIQDLGTANGTWLNGEKVRGLRPLAKGDRVMIGHTMITMVPA